MTKVLFVCLGNICRSPTAHGVFAHQVAESGLSDRIRVDSAGTSGWHDGGLPDSRSMQQAADHGYDLSFIRSSKVASLLILLSRIISWLWIERTCRTCKRSVHKSMLISCGSFLIMRICRYLKFRIPYYGGNDGFERVLNLVELGGVALLDHLKKDL